MATVYSTQYNKLQVVPVSTPDKSYAGNVKFYHDTYTFGGAVAGTTVSFGNLEVAKIPQVILTFGSFDAFEGMFTVQLGATVLAKMDVENGSIRIPLTKAVVSNAIESEMKIVFETGCDATAGTITLSVLYI